MKKGEIFYECEPDDTNGYRFEVFEWHVYAIRKTTAGNTYALLKCKMKNISWIVKENTRPQKWGWATNYPDWLKKSIRLPHSSAESGLYKRPDAAKRHCLRWLKKVNNDTSKRIKQLEKQLKNGK